MNDIRKDDNGKWSHKDGGHPATNLDSDKNIINDPSNVLKIYSNKICIFIILEIFKITILKKNPESS